MSEPILTPEALAAAVARVERLAQWYLSQAALVSNLGKPLDDNEYGRDAAALRLLLALAAAHVPVEDRESAVHVAANAAEEGLGLVMEIVACNDDPWKWQYPRYLSDDFAYDCARSAARIVLEARRLLKLPAREGA